MKRLALALLLSATGCAAQLATLPPSDTYTVMEGEPPRLTSDEQKLFDSLNKQFIKLGLPTASLGSYEQNAAAIMANAALAKVWHGSGRAIAQQDPVEIAPPVSGQEGKVEKKHEVAHGRLSTLTDEEDDGQIKHLHTGQHLTAHGIPQNVGVLVYAATYAQTTIDDDALRNLALALRPLMVSGELKMGIVILPVGDADQRIFVMAIRDRAFDLSKGPQRFAPPGTTFEVAGTVYDRGLTDVKLALQGPDGKVLLNHAPVDPQGNFSSTMTIPNAPGLYVFGAGDGTDTDRGAVKVPIFAGVAPTPWPVAADPKEAPLDGTRALAQRLAKAIAEWRHSHGFSVVPIDPNLSAFAKSEATAFGTATDASAGEGSGTPWLQLQLSMGDRFRAAGLDPKKVAGWTWIVSDSYLADFFARFPPSPFVAAHFSSPSVEKIGIGVVLVPNAVSKADSVRYCIDWVIQDPTPPTFEPKPIAVATNQPLTVAIRADGTAAVDGAQVDDARLKQAIDTARSVNPDLEVVLQVEAGAKPEVVQHVTDVIKAEGVVSIISHPPEPPAVPPPPTPAPTKTW